MQFSEDKSLCLDPELPNMPCFSTVQENTSVGTCSVNMWSYPKDKYKRFVINSIGLLLRFSILNVAPPISDIVRYVRDAW